VFRTLFQYGEEMQEDELGVLTSEVCWKEKTAETFLQMVEKC
jgi:hypothetical protein